MSCPYIDDPVDFWNGCIDCDRHDCANWGDFHNAEVQLGPKEQVVVASRPYGGKNYRYRKNCMHLRTGWLTDLPGYYAGQGDARRVTLCVMDRFTRDNFPANYSPDQLLCPENCGLYQTRSST